MMRITNLQNSDRQKILTSDVCIIGAGPAGLTIATELAQTRLRVLVLESGAVKHEDEFVRSLNSIESVGAPREMDPRKVRNRILGGSSHTWSGRCTPLDQIDYEEREWVPGSGWPVTVEQMEPYVVRAASYLGLVPMQYDSSLLKMLQLSTSFDAEEPDGLRSVFWQFSRNSSLNSDFVRFGPRFRRLSADNISVITNATATQLLLNEYGNCIHEIEISSPNGIKRRVQSRYVVLCAGAIENARLLLASSRQQIRGIGNQNDVVGRYLMDHPRATLGTFPQTLQGTVQLDLGLFQHPSGATLQRGLSLTAAVQQGLGLLNCSAWTTQHVDEEDAWRALRSMGRNNGTDRLALGRIVLRNADQILGGVWAKLSHASMPRRMGRLDLDMMVEQSPCLSSRVMLSDKVDVLGMPRARIDWRIGAKERETAIHLGHAVNAAMARRGKPQAILKDWVRERRAEDAIFCDSAHPSGTTRMSNDERTGVVDANGKVYGLENLYIAGSSVFPTAGHANPTFMIVALALRLAERLKKVDTPIIMASHKANSRTEGIRRYEVAV